MKRFLTCPLVTAVLAGLCPQLFGATTASGGYPPVPAGVGAGSGWTSNPAAGAILAMNNSIISSTLSGVPVTPSLPIAYAWDVNVTVTLTHPKPDDLTLSLLTATNQRITLSAKRMGSSAVNQIVYCFDDQANALAPTAGNTGGFYVPEGALTALQGVNANQLWRLRVENAGSIIGTIDNFQVEVTALTDPLPARHGPSTFLSSPDRQIPDGTGQYITDSTVIGGMGSNTAELRVTAFIEHPSPGDLEISLLGPAQIELSLRRGGANANVFNGVTWTDFAKVGNNDQPTTTHSYIPNTLPPGGLVPESALGRSIGLNPNDGWVIKIKDTQANGLAGKLVQWSVTVWTWDPPSGVGQCRDGFSVFPCTPLLTILDNPRRFTASGIDGARTGLFIYGVNGIRPSASQWGPFSTLCLNPPIQRMTPMANQAPPGNCGGVVSEEWSAFHAAHPFALGAAQPAGQQVHVQYWWRDPQSFPKNSQLTNYRTFVLP